MGQRRLQPFLEETFSDGDDGSLATEQGVGDLLIGAAVSLAAVREEQDTGSSLGAGRSVSAFETVFEFFALFGCEVERSVYAHSSSSGSLALHTELSRFAGILGYPASLQKPLSRRKKDPLRALTEPERQALRQISRSQSAPAVQVARAKMLLLVADGADYQTAAQAVGRRSIEAVSNLVARFNQEGLSALQPRHGGGQRKVYAQRDHERILREFARTPAPEADGTATWSLSTLQKALRQAPDGLPNVSTYTIWQVLREAGNTHQQSRTWCPTGTVQRKRKDGIVTVTDPDAEAKKS